MAEYIVFIWDDEAAWGQADPAFVESIQAAHQDFIARHADVLRGGNRLHPSAAATSLRRCADGGVSISDGAFAETKEVIGGYYLIDAADRRAGARPVRRSRGPPRLDL
jgi:hypothetical protein